MASAIRCCPRPPCRWTALSQDEKIAIVEKLDGKGVFLFKGAVALVAGRLQTSEATIYRYLSKINRAGGKNGLQ